MRKKGFVLALGVFVLSFLAVSYGWAEVVEGEITQIDLKGHVLSIRTPQEEVLSVAFDPVDFIVWKGDDEVEPEEIQVGHQAELGYYADENGANIASWVDLTPISELEGTPQVAEEGEE